MSLQDVQVDRFKKKQGHSSASCQTLHWGDDPESLAQHLTDTHTKAVRTRYFCLKKANSHIEKEKDRCASLAVNMQTLITTVTG